MSSYADNPHDPPTRDGSSLQNSSTHCAGGPTATACGGGGAQDDGSCNDDAIALVGNNNEGNVNHARIDNNGDSSPDAATSSVDPSTTDSSSSSPPNDATPFTSHLTTEVARRDATAPQDNNNVDDNSISNDGQVVIHSPGSANDNASPFAASLGRDHPRSPNNHGTIQPSRGNLPLSTLYGRENMPIDRVDCDHVENQVELYLRCGFGINRTDGLSIPHEITMRALVEAEGDVSIAKCLIMGFGYKKNDEVIESKPPLISTIKLNYWEITLYSEDSSPRGSRRFPSNINNTPLGESIAVRNASVQRRSIPFGKRHAQLPLPYRYSIL